MLLFALLTIFALTEGAKLPKSWKTCKLSDPNMNKCLIPAVTAALNDLMDGDSSLGVLPLNPLHIDKLYIDQGSGPVSIKLDFTDLDVKGLDVFEIKEIKNDWKKMEVHADITKVTLEGKYKINGKVLVLPISGEGDCVVEMDNFKAVGTLKFGQKDISGKKHYTIDDFDFQFDTNHMKTKFENLFNGDKALGDNMNVFLNENWKEILQELKPAIIKAFSTAFKQIANRIFEKVDMNSITPP